MSAHSLPKSPKDLRKREVAERLLQRLWGGQSPGANLGTDLGTKIRRGAFARDNQQALATRLLDERVVVYRLSDGSVVAARDICYHCGVPLSLGYVEGDEIVCRYHGQRYDRSGRCTCVPAHRGGDISPQLRLDVYQAQEKTVLSGYVWSTMDRRICRNWWSGTTLTVFRCLCTVRTSKPLRGDRSKAFSM
jgi:nitrite reductase/ring-hydroxylating ferredoxin subunit